MIIMTLSVHDLIASYRHDGYAEMENRTNKKLFSNLYDSQKLNEI